jgi:hypothetical protein
MSQKRTIFNDEYSWDRLGIILVYGDVQPTYLVATISDEYIIDIPGVVTQADGGVVLEVDNEPCVNFLVKSGIIKEESISISLSPIYVDFGDGSQPVMRAITDITAEGYVIFSTAIPVGATIRCATINASDVLESAELMLDAALSVPDSSELLSYSCVSRFAALGENSSAEMDTAASLIGNRLPYMLTYSGGEVCPVPGPNQGETINQFHNFTIVSCLF